MPKDWIYEEFGRKLKSSRKNAKLTQEEIAGRVGLSRTSITNIESGRQHLQLHMVFLLAEAIGVNPVSLLPDHPNESLSLNDKTLKELGSSIGWYNKILLSSKNNNTGENHDDEEA